MNKYYKIKNLFIAAFILISMINICFASDNDYVPTPPKRPDILNVSPAYIEELKNRFNPKKDISIENDGKIETVKNINSKELIKILEIPPPPASRVKDSYVPIPSNKPDPPNITPISNNIDNKGDETTLISFVLKPKQIKLDKNLEDFLRTHAIEIFNENPNLTMDIHAYATPIEGETHSEVRISLARALKIRSFLINNEIAPHRLKLSPMGSDENDDRIDLIFVKSKK